MSKKDKGAKLITITRNMKKNINERTHSTPKDMHIHTQGAKPLNTVFLRAPLTKTKQNKHEKQKKTTKNKKQKNRIIINNKMRGKSHFVFHFMMKDKINDNNKQNQIKIKK